MARSQCWTHVLRLYVLHLLLFVQICHSSKSGGSETDDDKLISLLLKISEKKGNAEGSQASQILKTIEAAENATPTPKSTSPSPGLEEDTEFDEIIGLLKKSVWEAPGKEENGQKKSPAAKRSDSKEELVKTKNSPNLDRKKVVTRSNYHDHDDLYDLDHHLVHDDDHSSWAGVRTRLRIVVIGKLRLRRRLLRARLRALAFLTRKLVKARLRPDILILKDAPKGGFWMEFVAICEDHRSTQRLAFRVGLVPSLLKTTTPAPVKSGWSSSSSSWISDTPPGWKPEPLMKPSYEVSLADWEPATTPNSLYGAPPPKYSDITSYSAPEPPKYSGYTSYSAPPPPKYSGPTGYSAAPPPNYSGPTGYSAPPPPNYSEPSYSAPPPPKYSEPTGYSPSPSKYSAPTSYNAPPPPKYSVPFYYSETPPPSPGYGSNIKYGSTTPGYENFAYQHATPPPSSTAPPPQIAYSSYSGSESSQLLTAPSDQHITAYLRQFGMDHTNLSRNAGFN
ncbi:hypothetical protein Ocin01_18337 [Orchesella cincta]|uniref:Uncharacterized protein n=1 Tax=Orchesella cincta TaxID=48709 RepID=A0A1D2M5U1_ORCCI|nr:hypothetical protein Ocin01_18337 [Orchesella cincta]